MARFSSIHHPPGSYFLRIHQHLVDTFGGDICCAAIVSVLDFLTASKLEELDAAGESEGLLWVTLSVARLHDYICGLYSTRRIADRLAFLAANQVIILPTESDLRFRDTERRLTFLLNRALLDDFTSHGTKLLFSPTALLLAADKCPQENVNPNSADKCPGQMSADKCPGQMSAKSESPKDIGSVENRREQKNPPIGPLESPIQPQNQNLNPTLPPPSPSGPSDGGSGGTVEKLHNYDPDIDIDVFTRNSYSCIRNLRFKTSRQKDQWIIEKLQLLESQQGLENFREALLCFLESDTSLLRTKRWPITEFLKQFGPVQGNHHSRTEPGRHLIFTGGGGTATPQIQPSGSEGQILGHRWYVDRWNELVPSARVRLPNAYSEEPSFKTNELSAIWEDICRHAQAHYEADDDPKRLHPSEWLTLDWILKDKNGVPNWRGFLARKPKPKKRDAAMEAVLANRTKKSDSTTV